MRTCFRPLRLASLGLATAALVLTGCQTAPPKAGNAAGDVFSQVSTNVFFTPVNQLLTPVGLQIELPGMRPQALALSPDGRLLVTAGRTHELLVLDPATGEILQHVPLPTDKDTAPATGLASEQVVGGDKERQLSFTGLVFSPDGKRLYLANVSGNIKVFSTDKSGKVSGLFTILLPPANAPGRKPEIPAGLAVSPDGKRLYVCANLSNHLLELDATDGKLLRTWDVGVAPFDVALVGRKIYVSNWGGRRPEADSLTGPAGRGTTVRVDPVRYIANEGSVSEIRLDEDSEAGGQTSKVGSQNSEIITGLHASALAVSPDQRWLVVANTTSDTLSVIDTRTDKIVETIWARQSPADLSGAQPTALAFDRSGKKLFVCNGTQNAVAVIDFKPGDSQLRGLIPVGWYPGAIAVSRPAFAGLRYGQPRLFVANIKGLGNNASLHPEKNKGSSSLQHRGSLSLLAVPSETALPKLTQIALGNMRHGLLEEAKLPARADQPARPVPERVGEPSVFKHVVYIIKENRTYDQVLGDDVRGNGDASLCVFGGQITPNLHKLVREFALLDNTYCSGALSADGHQWTDTGMVTDYLERSFAGFPRSYPSGGDGDACRDALAYSPAGFIWDNAIAHGKTLRNYGEFTTAHKQWKDPARKGKPAFLDCYRDFLSGSNAIAYASEPDVESLRPYIVTNTLGWDLSVPDLWRAANFIRDLRQCEQRGAFPDFVMLWLPNDHTSGTRAGAPTPAAHVADNDLAFGRIVEAISHSQFWKDTCIFAIEDDPQNGWDHVSGFRTTAYVISPYTRRGAVVSTAYNNTSVLRTMELMLGLPPMNQLDATATPMSDCFTNTPDFTAFDSVTNNVALDAMNPEPKKVSDALQRKQAYASARLPLARPDECPEDELNRILWTAMKGPQAPYPAWAVKPVKDEDD